MVRFPASSPAIYRILQASSERGLPLLHSAIVADQNMIDKPEDSLNKLWFQLRLAKNLVL
mgnify:FL=1